MRSALRFAAIASLLGLSSVYCSSGNGTVSLAPSIIIPEDLLAGVTKLTVSVYDTNGGALSCNTVNGTVTGLTSQAPLASKDMSSTGCPGAAKFCGSISVDQSSDPRLFTAQAFIGTTLQASGCQSATPNQSTLQVTIKMLRTLQQSICNGQPSPTITQCPTAGVVGDPVCDPTCHSLEENFSTSDGSSTNGSTAKVRPQLVWPAGTGDPGRLIGVWGEKAAGGNEVSMRVLDDSMEPYTGQSACIQASSFRMPITATAPCPGQLAPFPQFNPTIASNSGNYFIAFTDGTSGPLAIKIRSFDPILTPGQASPVVVSDAAGSAQSAPSMAINGNNLFVAWENGSGTVVGKVVSTSMTVSGTNKTIGPGVADTVTVASTTSGWAVSYLNAGDVMMANVDATGAPGTPIKVSSASGNSHPGIAAFGSNVAVVWQDAGGNILVQRFMAGTPVANDQATPLQDPSLTSGQKEPSVAAGSNFFVATWVDGTTGHVRARFLDGTGGFFFNFVNGQSSDFQASLLDGETRDNPVAASGGATPFVTIAWEDNTGSPGSFKGIFGRRFPLPAQ